MDEFIFTSGCIKAILDKYTDPIVKAIKKFSIDTWEHFKIDFDLAFINYLQNACAKYSHVKTILYKAEPQYLYDFFEVPYIEKDPQNLVLADNINTLLGISNFLVIKGTGGIGKSTLMKHLFLNEVEKKDLIPIFIELKDINDTDDNYTLQDFIFSELEKFGSTLNKEYLEYALKSGCFLFLFDGYDEIITEKRNCFYKMLDTFCDKYSKNYYIVSSRPYSEFFEFKRFTILNTCPFSKEQAISLIQKIIFDDGIKQRFITALDNKLYETHKSFASNPLLLGIMLLTFDNYAEIPQKLHLFYANAFETLYEKHDATKAGYRREMLSELPYDSFRYIFSCFCFTTYAQGKIEFTKDELIAILKKISSGKISFNVENYILDLVNSLCMLYKDGLNYKFSHRSFQEYFTAFFLKETSDDIMKTLSAKIIKEDIYRITHDSVFDMLFDMSKERFEQNILLPIIKKVEVEIGSNAFDFYFERMVKAITYDILPSSKDNRIVLFLTRGSNTVPEYDFLYECSGFYRDLTTASKIQMDDAESALYNYWLKRGYTLHSRITVDEIMHNEELYRLVKKTWIGNRISIITKLRSHLEKNIEKHHSDLLSLISY